MKISNTEFKAILKRVEKSITSLSKNDTVQNFHCLQLDSGVDGVDLLAYNRDTESLVRVSTNFKSDFIGNIFLTKKDLTKIKKLKSDYEFNFENKFLKSGNFNINFDVYFESLEEFVPTENINNEKIVLSDKVVENIHRIIQVADVNNPKYELNGILIENVNRELNIVSTDTRRLAVLSDIADYEDFSINPHKIPLENVDFSKVDYFQYSDKYMIIKEGNITHYVRLFQGRFPEYKRIIPSSMEVSKEVSGKKLREVLKECFVFGRDVAINGNTSLEVLDHNHDLECTYKHDFDFEDINITFNIKYVIDALSDCKNNFSVNANNLPFVVENEIKTVIMPIVR